MDLMDSVALKIILAVRYLSGSLFLLALMYGLTKMAGGATNPEIFAEGKNIVKNAVFGFMIILFATTIPELLGNLAGVEPFYIHFGP